MALIQEHTTAHHPGPLFLASACLCGLACRYDGKSAPVEELAALHAKGLVLAVCPETAGGLGTPRDPCEIRQGRVMTRQGKDVTEQFQRGAEHALAQAKQYGIRYAVLKENSPSCGSAMIYDGTFSRQAIPGQGLTAALLARNGILIFNERTFRNMPCVSALRAAADDSTG